MGRVTQTRDRADLSVTGTDGGAVAEALGVDPAPGLGAAEAGSRLASHGPNQLTRRRDRLAPARSTPAAVTPIPATA